MRILFMGGTGFIGPHMVRALRERGHRFTLFNRGKTNPGLFPDLELIQGDRLTDAIEQLRGRDWDVVIDTSAYFPRAVTRLFAQLDLESVRQYVFISTISVYSDFGRPGIFAGAILAFLSSWNEFLFALTLTRKNAMTVPIVTFRYSVDKMIGGLLPASTI